MLTVGSRTVRGSAILGTSLLAAVGISLASTGAAHADTVLTGLIDLGTADSFGVLAYNTVTDAGTSTINGDVGIFPGSALTGSTTINGATYLADGVAEQAKIDLATAYGIAAGLTSASVVPDIVGLTLVPGVYSTPLGALSLSGGIDLDAAGDPDAVWVFQAASTLTIGASAAITFSGGASSCNVFWQVGSSATILGGANFAGTVMADQAITAVTGATIQGRLLAMNAAVTLDDNVITTPSGCAAAGSVLTSPTVTSGTPTAGSVGTPYSYPVTATGTPTLTYTITSGSLPPGLALDASGVISGVPTTDGTYTFTVTVSNGTSPDVVLPYAITVSLLAALPPTGAADTLAPALMAGGVILVGVLLVATRAARARAGLARTP